MVRVSRPPPSIPSPVVSVAAETVSLSRSFGEHRGLSHAVPLQAGRSRHLVLRSARALPGGSRHRPARIVNRRVAPVANEIPRRHFSQLASPLNVDWSRGGTAVTVIGFNYPPISLMHCAGEPVGRCFYVLSGGGRLLIFFSLSCTWLFFLFVCLFFLLVVSFTASRDGPLRCLLSQSASTYRQFSFCKLALKEIPPRHHKAVSMFLLALTLVGFLASSLSKHAFAHTPRPFCISQLALHLLVWVVFALFYKRFRLVEKCSSFLVLLWLQLVAARLPAVMT